MAANTPKYKVDRIVRLWREGVPISKIWRRMKSVSRVTVYDIVRRERGNESGEIRTWGLREKDHRNPHHPQGNPPRVGAYGPVGEAWPGEERQVPAQEGVRIASGAVYSIRGTPRYPSVELLSGRRNLLRWCRICAKHVIRILVGGVETCPDCKKRL